MTAGLIRSETAGDLRTLTAAGAGGLTRRGLTGVTAGVIAFLGAALATVAACLAVLVWSHADLTATFSNVPWSDIGLLVVGMPLIGAAAAWLLGGRQPYAVSRQPLDSQAPGGCRPSTCGNCPHLHELHHLRRHQRDPRMMIGRAVTGLRTGRG